MENPTENILDKSVLHLLHRVVQHSTDRFHSNESLSELTPRQYAVLVTVAQYEGVNQTDLVKLTSIDRSTLSEVTKRMVVKGLLVRSRKKNDARTYCIHLSEKGSNILKSAEPAASSLDKQILAGLTEEQREEFLRILHTMVQSMTLKETAQP